MTRNTLYILILWLCLLFGITEIQAQISVSVPSRVSTGENFRLSYTINTQDVEDFRAGDIPGGLELIAGPYTSQQSSYQMVNGHTSSSSSITFTYTLYAEKPGTYTIPAAHAKIKGRTVSSQSVRVTVSGQARKNANGSPQMHQDDDRFGQMRNSGSAISGKDLFIKVSANKRRVHEQEPVLLTYKVYTLVDLTQLEGKMPDLTGFHSQEVPLPQQKSFKVERVNGRPYRTVTWSQYVMYPQMTGKLQVPSITFKGIVVQQNRAVDPFEAFFNGGSGYVEVKKNIDAPGVTIQVDPLPEKPAGFSGGVGRFNISAQLNKTEVKAGDPITMRIVVSGVGNLKLIKLPEINFPKNFDRYDPKITDKTKLTANGVEGNMVYDILFVPRSQGKYTIPAVNFVYFDVHSDSYKTVKTNPIDIVVGKGDGRNTSENYESAKDNDIRNIKTGEINNYGTNRQFVGSAGYWVSLLLPLLTFVLLLIIFRKRAMDHADIINMRQKKADKIARKRLRKANQLMRQGKGEEFYDEVLRALWDYVGYKLNMPVEKLSRENIAETFMKHEVRQDTIDKFLSALDTCEFERYAPGDVAGNMEKTYSTAAIVISEIEDVMKKKRKL
ncbi:BatD family protein [Bacteroidales bacterium KA00344]|nr:BatD family protein [Bacteroidales bacterium KA00344]